MSSRRNHLTYALGTLVMGVALLLAGPVAALADESNNDSTQPNLKSWSNISPNVNKRFVVLPDFNNAAVLDRETGLVWEKSPDSAYGGPQPNWYNARTYCANKTVGGRKAWRLPSVIELASLINPTIRNPALPLGHPFTNIQSVFPKDWYWTATNDVVLPDGTLPNTAWFVRFFDNDGNADPNTLVSTYHKVNMGSIWCVRGPMNADTY